MSDRTVYVTRVVTIKYEVETASYPGMSDAEIIAFEQKPMDEPEIYLENIEGETVEVEIR